MNQSLGPEKFASFYTDVLLHDIVPFWMRHGIDERHGGISNVLDEAGRPLNYDKYLWSQGRALWTFSALYNRIEQRYEWLDFAHHIYRYLRTHGRDAEGRWMYRLGPMGAILERDTSIFVDAFVMHGLAEYYRATGDADALELALETFKNTRARLAVPGSYGVAPYAIPQGLKMQGISMIFSFFNYHLGQVADRDDIRAAGLEMAHEILRDFYRPEKNAILEFVTLEGQFHDSPPGRTCVPGHAIEALWFLMQILEAEADRESLLQCCRLVERHVELAWDEEFGGLMLARDIDGRQPVYWKNAECKPWWVQVEALVATALAYRHTGNAWCLDWQERIRQWAFEHYPVPGGEWRQWVNRAGEPMASSALPVKDPFHLPRALMYLTDIWGRDSRTAPQGEII